MQMKMKEDMQKMAEHPKPAEVVPAPVQPTVMAAAPQVVQAGMPRMNSYTPPVVVEQGMPATYMAAPTSSPMPTSYMAPPTTSYSPAPVGYPSSATPAYGTTTYMPA